MLERVELSIPARYCRWILKSILNAVQRSGLIYRQGAVVIVRQLAQLVRNSWHGVQPNCGVPPHLRGHVQERRPTQHPPRERHRRTEISAVGANRNVVDKNVRIVPQTHTMDVALPALAHTRYRDDTLYTHQPVYGLRTPCTDTNTCTRNSSSESNTCVIRRWAFLILVFIGLLSCIPPPTTLLSIIFGWGAGFLRRPRTHVRLKSERCSASFSALLSVCAQCRACATTPRLILLFTT